MPERYFEKFKKIYYANTQAINITERAVVLNSVFQNPYLFYPYDLTNSIRADQISDAYYNDQYMSWLIYLSNKTIDPYYEWYLSEEEFDAVITKKYGTDIYALQQKIAFFRNNWAAMEGTEIPASVYDGYSNNVKKYWEPVYGNYGVINFYKRKRVDTQIKTNNIVTYNVYNGIGFIKGEVVTITFEDEEQHVGRGEVAYSTDNSVTIQHTFGYTVPGVDGTLMFDLNDPVSTIRGVDSQHITGIYSGNAVLVNGERIIPLDEIVYWYPVSVYEYENELNSQNKTIKVVDSRLSMQVANELKKLMK